MREGGYGWTPLMLASRLGSSSMIRALLEEGADVRARSTDDRTSALALAAAARNPDAVRMLLAAGADINAYEQAGAISPVNHVVLGNAPPACGCGSPLGCALCRSMPHLVRSPPAEQRLASEQDQAYKRARAVLMLLLQAGTNVNLPSGRVKFSALELAVALEDAPIVRCTCSLS